MLLLPSFVTNIFIASRPIARLLKYVCMYVCIYVNTCASSGQQPKLAAVLKHVLSSICPGTRANIHPYWDPQGKSLTYTRNPTPWDEMRTVCAYKYMLLAHQPGLRDSEG
jgi:hypothetical protein